MGSVPGSLYSGWLAMLKASVGRILPETLVIAEEGSARLYAAVNRRAMGDQALFVCHGSYFLGF